MPRPKRSRISILECSVPAEYVFPDAALFTKKWWSNVVKMDAFWMDLGKHLSQTIIRKRITVDIKTETEGQSQKQYRGEGSLNTQEELAREVEELREMAEEAGFAVTGERKRSRKSTANGRYEKGECVRCGRSCPWSEMDFDASSNPICTKCIDASEAETNITTDIPTVQAEPHRPVRGRQSTRLATTNVLSITDDEESSEIQAGRTSATSGSNKRSREDSGQVVTIQGRQFLVYIDQDSNAHLVKLEEHSSKRVKSLGER